MLCSRGAARVVQQGWGHDRGSAVQVGVCASQCCAHTSSFKNGTVNNDRK